MTKRRHDQLGDAPTFVCTACKQDNCPGCVDVLRSVYSQDLICRCRRKNHRGEPRDNQISDPFTGTVHGPGVRVKSDGTVQVEVVSVTHLCPPLGSGIMPCCGRTPFEVNLTDRITEDESQVTCR